MVFVDRLERVVECEGVYHDLQKNIATTTVVRRTIELKKGKSSVDLDMIQLAGAAGMSIARRNAILGGVPRPVWEPVLEKVEQVIRGDAKTLGERRDRAIAYFAKANIGVERLLKALDKPSVDDVDLDDLMTMNGWRVAITQGDSSLDEIFPEERKPGPKNLSEKLDALANGSPPAPVGGEGEGSAAPNAPSPSEGGSSNPPEGAAAPGVEGAAASPSDGKPARKPASGPDRRPAREGPAAAKTPASGPPKPAEAASRPAPSARDALAATGSEMAAKGHDALMEWLDNLPGDQVALITPLMEKLLARSVPINPDNRAAFRLFALYAIMRVAVWRRPAMKPYIFQSGFVANRIAREQRDISPGADIEVVAVKTPGQMKQLKTARSYGSASTAASCWRRPKARRKPITSASRKASTRWRRRPNELHPQKGRLRLRRRLLVAANRKARRAHEDDRAARAVRSDRHGRATAQGPPGGARLQAHHGGGPCCFSLTG